MATPTPLELRGLARRDTKLGAAMKRLAAFPGFPDAGQRTQRTHWDALARAIVFQQLATKAAETIHGRVCTLAGGKRFPKCAELLAYEDAHLRGAGLSQNKMLALRDLALRIEEGRLDLRRLERISDEDIVERLVEVRGIGEWSAQMFLMFRLGRLDIGPSGDLGVQEGLRLLDGLAERPTPKVALARMEVWRPLRSVGAWMMWRLVEAERSRSADPK
ncbi:MAG: DNA-3-methyladenine glycosylase 2 family protein [Planctomycetota bacterium]|nr:DNA-3-methyladenine glycosylase 2 family protein [Planctomycetota bacterium]